MENGEAFILNWKTMNKSVTQQCTNYSKLPGWQLAEMLTCQGGKINWQEVHPQHSMAHITTAGKAKQNLGRVLTKCNVTIRIHTVSHCCFNRNKT